eukprot:366364-Chlamydomonas_euryale.AAC.4
MPDVVTSVTARSWDCGSWYTHFGHGSATCCICSCTAGALLPGHGTVAAGVPPPSDGTAAADAPPPCSSVAVRVGGRVREKTADECCKNARQKRVVADLLGDHASSKRPQNMLLAFLTPLSLQIRYIVFLTLVTCRVACLHVVDVGFAYPMWR